MRPFPLALVALLVLASAPAIEAHHRSHVQPGARLADICSLNFVFDGPEDALYIGTAEHCIGPVGSRAIAPEFGEFGTVVFEDKLTTAELEQGIAGTDFSLILVDADKHALVDAAMRTWGGPLGVEREPEPGTPTLHHGQGLVWSAPEPTRGRVGVLQSVQTDGMWAGWWHADAPILGGDSGSPVLSQDGEALGHVSIVSATFAPDYGTDVAVLGGPTLALVLDVLQAEGWDVALRTAPLVHPATVPAAIVEHCVDRPLDDIAHTDACLRRESIWNEYHAVTPEESETTWIEFPWAAAATPAPQACPRLPYFPTLLLQPCQENVVIVQIPTERWDGALDIELSWPDAANDLDLYVYDAADTLLGSSAQSGTTSERVHVEAPPAGHYRLTVVPRLYVAESWEDDGIRLTARLA